jgi:hypothetical protein
MLAVGAGRQRMGWLLRVNRMLGPDQDLATAARFAGALRSLGGAGPASPAQVSKWETGAARVGHGTVRRYERLLGLPVNRLAAMAGLLPGTGVEPTGGDPHVLPDLLDAGLCADPMTGPRWDDLTALLQGRPDVLVHPRNSWERLTHRLLTEMVIADGLPWIQRNAALARLLRHPSGGADAIAACASFAADPAHQVFVEPLAALHVTAHPDASRRVLAQLAEPSSGRALCGAMLAVIRKLDRGHLGPADVAALARAVCEIATDPRLPDEVHHLVPVLAAGLPPGADGPAVTRLRRLAGADVVGPHVLGRGRTHPAETTGTVVARVVLRTLTYRDLPETDPVLPVLVDEMIFAPDPVTRLEAGFLIAATPYRDPVAAAVTAEVPAAVRGDAVRAVALLTALGALGAGPDRALLERLVLAPAVRPAVNEAAARALGLVPGRSTGRFWAVALRRHLDAWRRTGSPTTLTTVRRLVQALGVADERGLLAALAGDVGIPSAVRTAAAWWASVPTTVRESAAA